MSTSIYDLEAEQQGTRSRDGVIDITSAMMTMTASFAFCAIFMATVFSAFNTGWAFMFFVILRTMLVVGVMLLAASILAFLFDNPLVRRMNAVVLGMIMAFSLVFLNI